MRRHAVPVFGALFALMILVAAPAANAAPKDFIRDIADRAFASLGEDGISQDERTKRFRSLLNEAFDIPRIARFTLGRYWRVASESQQKEYTGLFEDFVVQAYANRFKDLGGKKLVINQERELEQDATLVITEVEIPGQPSVKINWRVEKESAGYKIVDVMVEGISMSVTQRDEFAAVIRQNGGKVDGLIEALRKKTGNN